MIVAISRRYKFFWQCCNKGTAGVGVFSAERWIDRVVDVVRVNERIMYVKLVIGKQIGNIVYAYAPQVDLAAEEKDDFWTALSLRSGGDADGYGGVHGGMGFGIRNTEGKMILDLLMQWAWWCATHSSRMKTLS